MKISAFPPLVLQMTGNGHVILSASEFIPYYTLVRNDDSSPVREIGAIQTSGINKPYPWIPL